MTPLRVTCRVQGQVCLPGGALALDALLGAAYSVREALPPPTVQLSHCGALPRLPLPLARSLCDRLWLASWHYARWDAEETRHANRRFPVWEALALGDDRRVARVNTAAGPERSYRIQYSAGLLAGDELAWHCLGIESEVRSLLAYVTHVGKRRAVGYGRVLAWAVEPCESWGRGFPVLDPTGRPTRPLPVDWLGLSLEASREHRVLDPPYWDRTREELCAVPT